MDLDRFASDITSHVPSADSPVDTDVSDILVLDTQKFFRPAGKVSLIESFRRVVVTDRYSRPMERTLTPSYRRQQIAQIKKTCIAAAPRVLTEELSASLEYTRNHGSDMYVTIDVS